MHNNMENKMIVERVVGGKTNVIYNNIVASNDYNLLMNFIDTIAKEAKRKCLMDSLVKHSPFALICVKDNKDWKCDICSKCTNFPRRYNVIKGKNIVHRICSTLLFEFYDMIKTEKIDSKFTNYIDMIVRYDKQVFGEWRDELTNIPDCTVC